MNHRLILAGAAVAAASASFSAAAATAEFVVMGANSSHGTMRAMLCRQEERFPNGCKLALAVPARVEGTSLVFDNLLPGRYALSVIHDEDDTRSLGVSRLSGKPKGIGFSNNVTGPGGVPTFGLAAVDVNSAGFKQTVKLRAFAFGH